MKIKLILAAIALIIAISAGLVYINEVFLPQKVESLVVEGIARATGKEVKLESLNFNLFKGLVLRGLEIKDASGPLLRVKRSSCRLELLPLLRRELVIHSLRIYQPQIYLSRHKDSPPGETVIPAVSLAAANPRASEAEKQKPGGFVFKIEAVEIFDGTLAYRDEALSPALLLKLSGFNCSVALSGTSPVAASIKGVLRRGSAEYSGLALSFDSTFQGELDYSPADNRLDYLFNISLANGDIRGIRATGDITGISSRLELSEDKLVWQDTVFIFLGRSCKSSGSIAGFKQPVLRAAVSSDDFSLDADLALSDTMVSVNNFSGKFLNSSLACSGKIDARDSSASEGVSGEANIDLEDLRRFLPKFEKLFSAMKPAGLFSARFKLSGDPRQLKEGALTLALSSSEFLLYGLRFKDLALDYAQKAGEGSVPLAQLSFYGGSISATSGINLDASPMPYWVAAGLKGVKLEQLKLDTAIKDKELSGTLDADCKINGLSNDFSAATGQGNIAITNGKLWELDLFKGMGAVLFPKSFQNIVFEQGRCAFDIKDKAIATPLLTLTGNYANLAGPVRLGFDGSVDASLNVDIVSDLAPSGTFKDVAAAIMSSAGGFGTIRITGSLKEPRYKFAPAVVNIIKGLADTFLKKQLQ